MIVVPSAAGVPVVSQGYVHNIRGVIVLFVRVVYPPSLNWTRLLINIIIKNIYTSAG